MHRRRLLSLLVLLAALAVAAYPQASKDRYVQHVKALTADAMEGRGAGTQGLARAEAYIAAEFRRLGLKPAGTDKYRQPFSVVTGAKLRGTNRLALSTGGSARELKLGEEFTPLSISASATAAGPLVFAGYGISAPELSYDDYTHLDVKGKLVLVLRREPKQFGEKAGHPGKLTHHAEIISKAINARVHGAAALLLVNVAEDEDVLLKFAQVAGPENAGIPILHVRREVAQQWFQAAGKSLADAQAEIDRSLTPASFAFPETLNGRVAVDIERTQATVSNLAAYLPGKTDEFVIVGAHYDHLGRGDQHSLEPSKAGSIHPGADDNASGTAGLLELARLFSARKQKPDRGILFLAFAGEEIGLLGSSHWVNHPTLPLEKAVAMINMDMIGRMSGNKIYIGGVGTGASFKPLLEKLAPQHRFAPEFSSGGYSSSDHTSFVSKKVPVLFFFSGLHSDYHKPSDTWEKIAGDSAASLLNLISEVATNIAAAPERPQFVAVEAAPSRGEGVSAPGYGAYFGSVPDFGQTENGVKFADVRPGSPAAKAGLAAGDVLVKFGNMDVKNLHDFTFALRRHKPGDVVTVSVLRDGKPLSVEVTLERRR